MNDPVDEKTLQEYLSGDSPLSRRYRELNGGGVGGDVPAHLDELILKQARDAVASASPVVPLQQSRLRQSRQRLMRWSVPAALAASTVLVLSIVIESGNRHEVTTPVQVPAAANGAGERARNEAPPVREDFRANQEEQSLAAPPAPADKRSLKPAPSMRAQKPADAAASIMQAPEETESVAAMAKRAGEPRQQALSSPVTDATGELTPQSPPLTTLVTPLPAPAASDSSADRKAAAALGGARNEQPASQRDDSRQVADVDLQEVAVTGARRAGQSSRATAGPRDTITQNAAAASRSDMPRSGATDEIRWRSQPEEWLKHIRQLRKEGSGAAADREWDEFRAAYPDYAVAETDAARAKR